MGFCYFQILLHIGWATVPVVDDETHREERDCTHNWMACGGRTHMMILWEHRQQVTPYACHPIPLKCCNRHSIEHCCVAEWVQVRD